MQVITLTRWTAAFICLCMLADPARAYMGPGMGLSAIAMMLSVFGSITFGFLAVIWYPIKRLYRRLRGRPLEDNPTNDE